MIPGTERDDVKWRSLEASHATSALIEVPPPGSGRIWMIRQVTAQSDTAGKVITFKVGASIAAVAQFGPTLEIGVESIVLPMTDRQVWSAGLGTSDNQAFTLACTAASAARITCEIASIPTPVRDTTTGFTVTTA